MTDYDSTYLWLFWFVTMLVVIAILSVFQIVGIISDSLAQRRAKLRRGARR